MSVPITLAVVTVYYDGEERYVESESPVEQLFFEVARQPKPYQYPNVRAALEAAAAARDAGNRSINFTPGYRLAIVESRFGGPFVMVDVPPLTTAGDSRFNEEQANKRLLRGVDSSMDTDDGELDFELATHGIKL